MPEEVVVEAPVVEAPVVEAVVEKPAASVVPEKYELKLPADATLDAAVLERTVAFARERKLSNDQAQAVLDQLNTEATTLKSALLPAYQPGGAEWVKSVTEHIANSKAQQVEAWKAETAADASLGRTPDERMANISRGWKVFDSFEMVDAEGAKGFRELLDSTGASEHRGAARFLVWLGRQADEARIVTGNTEGGERSAEEKLYAMYPTMKPAA